MQVRVELTEDDLWRYTRHALLRYPTTRRSFVGAAIGSAVLALVIPLLAGLPVWLAVASGILATPASTVLMLRSTRRQSLRAVSDQRGVLGEHHLELSPEGVRERTAFNDSLTSWAAIHEVERTEHAVHLTLGPASAHILPVRCFVSPQEADAFAAEARRHLDAARRPPPHRTRRDRDQSDD
jgi:hypothetical protein